MSDLRAFKAALAARPDKRTRTKIGQRPDIASFLRDYAKEIGKGEMELDYANCSRWLAKNKAFSVSEMTIRRWMEQDAECQSLVRPDHG